MTRYELFRRRIAPVLFLGMVGLIAFDAWRSERRTHATVVLDFGAAAPDVVQVDADLIVGGDVIGQFHRRALPDGTIGPCRFETAMPEDTGKLRIEVVMRGASPRTLERTIRPIEESETTVRLGPDLVVATPE